MNQELLELAQTILADTKAEVPGGIRGLGQACVSLAKEVVELNEYIKELEDRMVKECTKCHGSGWLRTTSLKELNRPDRCWECGGSGLSYHPFHPDDTPGKCSYCAYPIASWVHKTKEERK